MVEEKPQEEKLYGVHIMNGYVTVEPDSNPFSSFAVDPNNMIDENSLLSGD
jgi:hypothetical protein